MSMTPHTPLIEALKEIRALAEQAQRDHWKSDVLCEAINEKAQTLIQTLSLVRIATETTEPDAVQDGKQNFERFPKLASWIERLANTNCGMNLIEWTEFLFELNQACAQSSPSVQSIRAGEISFTLPPHAVRFLTEMCKRERHRMARESDLSLQSEAAFDSLNTIEESLP